MPAGVRKSKSGSTPAKEAPAAGESQVSPEKEGLIKIIEEAASKAPPKLQPYLKQAAPFLASAWIAFQIALPYIIKFAQKAGEIYGKAVEIYGKTSEKLIFTIIGFFVCFFGGVFPATIAAVEAWRLCGGMEAIASCKILWHECEKVYTESKEDDKKDDDNDGIADVKEIDAKTYIARKTSLVAKVVDPTQVNLAMVSLYTGWMGVLATLKIRFAKTVTLGHVIGDQLYIVAQRAEPAITKAVPEDYSKWVPMVVQWICKAIAISLAWWIQRVISAFHSAIRGSHLCSKYLVEYLKERHSIDLAGKFGDEVIPWTIAAAGLIFQFVFGFGVPFPFSLLTWPLSIIEYFVVWSVASGSDTNF